MNQSNRSGDGWRVTVFVSICAWTSVSTLCPQSHTCGVPVQVRAWRRGGVYLCVWVCYTRFSMPGSGCCIGTGASALPACWASCRTGMLHSGHTFLTSNHLMRHFLWKACLHGQIPSSSFCLNSSKHTAQISCKFSSLTFSFWITCLYAYSSLCAWCRNLHYK